ncbi:putative protein serine/threonine kinase [Tieghemostelium lacteum]|uniref:Protein kinase domain-containing protein n=1 Tax=Tieghemostelium lacteum TaxID=361077 RepID=A0A151ZCM3_TIELA|nr:putative protein serine/threonine kinase [Tieghemostelium lacteum]|eukprot:KYQ91696.1 putative protein serine/threonine kinase [Tieghemostelium lacteum]
MSVYSNTKSIFKGKKNTYILSSSDALGSGQFGKVFRARDSNNNFYAIKVPDTHNYNSEALKYLHSEQDILDSLTSQPDHPNVIKFYEKIDNDLVFELCNGGSLINYLQNNRNLPDRENFLKIVLCQLVNGLNYLHLLGVVHRDIKPENVLVSYIDGKMLFKISDFGLATNKHMDILKSNVGTPIFKAPEIGSDSYDYKVDICSLGKTIYSLSMPRHELTKNAFSLDPEDILKLKKSEEYKDLLIKMVDPVSSNRISLNEIKDHPFVLSRNVNLKFFPLSKLHPNRTINVQIAKQICLDYHLEGVNLNDYIILCSFFGSSELLPFSNDQAFNPIYTIESVILVSLKEPIQFPSEPVLSVNKDLNSDPIQHHKSKVEDCLAIINHTTFKNEFLLIYKAIYGLYKSKMESIDINSVFKKLSANIEKYKKSFQLIKSLMQMDSNGNDSDKPLIEQLSPFVQNFINKTIVLNYQEMINTQNLIDNQYLKEYFDLFHKFKSTSMEFVLSDSIAQVERVRSTIEDCIKLGAVNENDIQIVHRILSSFIPIYSSCIEHKSKFDQVLYNFHSMIALCNNISLLDEYQVSSIHRESELCMEISKIPYYYMLAKNELKRRSHWKSEFNKVCGQYATKIQTFIDKDQTSRSQFNRSVIDSNILSMNPYQKDIILNPLEQYLPNQQNEEIEGFFVIERKKLDIDTQKLNRNIDQIQQQVILDKLSSHKLDEKETDKHQLKMENKMKMDNLLLENSLLKQLVGDLKEKHKIHSQLESNFQNLKTEMENLSIKYQDLNLVVPNQQPVNNHTDLDTQITKKKQEIKEIFDQKERLEKYIQDFESRRDELDQTVQLQENSIKSSKRCIQELQREIKSSRDNEHAQQNYLNNQFNDDKENFQKQCLIKNDTIRKLKLSVQESEKKLTDLTTDQSAKESFDLLQKQLNEKDLEIDSLISKINHIEKLIERK